MSEITGVLSDEETDRQLVTPDQEINQIYGMTPTSRDGVLQLPDGDGFSKFIGPKLGKEGGAEAVYCICHPEVFLNHQGTQSERGRRIATEMGGIPTVAFNLEREILRLIQE